MNGYQTSIIISVIVCFKYGLLRARERVLITPLSRSRQFGVFYLIYYIWTILRHVELFVIKYQLFTFQHTAIAQTHLFKCTYYWCALLA